MTLKLAVRLHGLCKNALFIDGKYSLTEFISSISLFLKYIVKFNSSNFLSFIKELKFQDYLKGYGCIKTIPLAIAFLLVTILVKLFYQALLLSNIAFEGNNLGLSKRVFLSYIRSTFAQVNSISNNLF